MQTADEESAMSLGGALPGKEGPSPPYREGGGPGDSLLSPKLYALSYCQNGWGKQDE